MNERPHDIPDELISAYLDGELSPEEKARVEDLLIDSPEHRRLFEELKALRASLQTLPSYHLADDFAAKVLKRAEREMLTSPVEEAAEGERPVAVHSQPAPPVVPTPASQERRGSWRMVVWSASAVAAALLVALVAPQFTDQFKDSSRRIALEYQAENDAAVPAADESASDLVDAVTVPPHDRTDSMTASAERLDDQHADLAISPPASAGQREEDRFDGVPVEVEEALPAADPIHAEADVVAAAEAASGSLAREAAVPAGPPSSSLGAGQDGVSLRATDLVVSLKIPAEDFREKLAENGIVYISAVAGPDAAAYGDDFGEGALEDSRAGSPAADDNRTAEATSGGGDADFYREEALFDEAEAAELAEAENLRENEAVAQSLAESAQGEARGERAAGHAEQWIVVEASVEQVQRLLAQLGVEPADLSYLAEPESLAMQQQGLADLSADTPLPGAGDGFSSFGGAGGGQVDEAPSDVFAFRHAEDAEAGTLQPGSGSPAVESSAGPESASAAVESAPESAGVAYPVAPPPGGLGHHASVAELEESFAQNAPVEGRLPAAGEIPIRGAGAGGDAARDFPESSTEDNGLRQEGELRQASEPAGPVVRVFFRLQPSAPPLP